MALLRGGVDINNMDKSRYDMLEAAGPPLVKYALFGVAMMHSLPLDTVVQRALGRDLPGASPDLLAQADAAVDDLRDVMTGKAVREGVVLTVQRDGAEVSVQPPPSYPAEGAPEEQRTAHTVAVEAYFTAVDEVWAAARAKLTEVWPAPPSYAPLTRPRVPPIDDEPTVERLVLPGGGV